MKQLVFNYQVYISNTDVDFLNNILIELLNKCEYTILNKIEHYFEPHGYTCLWLLAESHLAVHTFPEENTSYIELSGCNLEKNNIFISTFKNDLKKLNILIRK